MIDEKKIDSVFVISNYKSLEKQLLECMDFIPYIEVNRDTVSPKYVPIILESCSLIESIFKSFVENDKKNYQSKDYSNLVEPILQLERAFSIMLVSPLEFFNPFENWTEEPPDWWQSYNNLKHDRLKNYKDAKIDIVIKSMCALHQVIARTIRFLPELVKDGWYNLFSGELGELMGELLIIQTRGTIGISMETIPVETELFVSPNHGNFVIHKRGTTEINKGYKYSSRVTGMIAVNYALS